MDESSLNPGCPAASESTFSNRWLTNDRIGSTERKLAVIWSRSDVGRHVGAAKAIDCLFGIADQKQRARTQRASQQIHGGSLAGFPAQEPDDLDLQRVGVLELVHQDMTEAARQRLADVLVPREQVTRGVEKVIEIKERSGALVAAPVLHQLIHLGRKPRQQLGCDRGQQSFEGRMTRIVVGARRIESPLCIGT
jgi:hypothetical protein